MRRHAYKLAILANRTLSATTFSKGSHGRSLFCHGRTQPLSSQWRFGAAVERCGYSTTTGFRNSDVMQQGLASTVEVIAPLQDIIVDELVINRASKLKVKPNLDPVSLRFGAVYTDHMLQISWKEGLGWSTPTIDPIAPLNIHPCAQVLHYALECFEGLKAYKAKDGSIRLFRPDLNMARFSNSARRLAFPALDEVAILELIKTLVRVERDWIPDKEGFSIYIRPTLISTHPFLGVGPSRELKLFVVLSPVGPYFSSGFEPIKLFVDSEHVRAFHGGVGDSKIGGNYAPTILPQLQAAEKGCHQVLYVLGDGSGKRMVIGESGAMNVFFLMKDKKGQMELATPKLNGVILPGVTRDTVLELTRSFGNITVSERDVFLDEVEEAAACGQLLEVFGTGTACMIQPVVEVLKSDSTHIHVPWDKAAALYWLNKCPGSSAEQVKPDEPFSLCGRLSRAILDVQHGHVDSDWSVVIDT